MLSETIFARLTERFARPLPDFHKRRIVFWLDPEGDFAPEVDALNLPGVNIVKRTIDNNFALKKLLAADDTTSDYLVYDPLTYAKDGQDDWLLDIKLHSEEFRADLVSMQMEELRAEPSAPMRKTVRLYAKFLSSKERKARLARLGREYQTPLALHIDIMAVLSGCGGGAAHDVFIAVLSAGLDRACNPALTEIEKYGSIGAFWELARRFTGYEDAPGKTLFDFAAHILLTALSQTAPASVLRGLEGYLCDSCKAYCHQLVRLWHGGGHRHALEGICRHVEQALGLAGRFDGVDAAALQKSDTFPGIDESILRRFFAEIGENVVRTDAITDMAERRRTAIWHPLTADYYECLLRMAHMQAFYIRHIEGFHMAQAAQIWDMYAADYYQMDSLYRKFHLAFGATLKNPVPSLEDALKKCVDWVEGLYREWFLKELTMNWTRAIADDMASQGRVKDVREQRHFYTRYVVPNVRKNNRVFVVISDGLRYEVASELAKALGRATKGKATLETMQAVFPGITKFGMAALLPGELTVNDKMEALADGYSTAGTPQRGAVLARAHPGSAALTYADLIQMKQSERREATSGKDVIYIYHNAIDAIGDKLPTEAKVFEGCETAIAELTAIVKIIVNDLSGVNILITADHGFLYTHRPLDESLKLSRQAFDGEVYELGRRYALAAPDTSAAFLLPVNTARALGGVRIQGFAPRDTVRMKVPGGGENYVHGGLSLQEMAVPVVIYKGMRAGYKEYVEVRNPGLTLLSESRRVSNLMFWLDFLQNLPVGDKVRPCRYTLHFADETGAAVSDSQTVIADRTHANAAERVYRVRFALKPMRFSRSRAYRLVIAGGDDAPQEIAFTIDIAYADDFGFDL